MLFCKHSVNLTVGRRVMCICYDCCIKIDLFLLNDTRHVMDLFECLVDVSSFLFVFVGMSLCHVLKIWSLISLFWLLIADTGYSIGTEGA